MRVLVTGAAGFIGMHISQTLLDRGDTVVGIDNLNDYYDVALKHARLKILSSSAGFEFQPLDLTDRPAIEKLFKIGSFDAVINLAAQAGVRYSVENPHVYVQSNIVGFLNVLEGCRHARVGHLVFASSSSVYGANTRMPFSASHPADHPLSLYGATKKSNELMAHAYANLYQMPVTGLRFFTVYGPWDRPDMALFKFASAIARGETIDVYNNGQMQRDFTYIDDIVSGVIRVLDRPAAPDPKWDGESPDPASSASPYRIYNIGNSKPEQLMKYIQVLESSLGRKANIRLMPMQPGDVPATYADVGEIMRDVGYSPSTSIDVGIPQYVEWFRAYSKS